MPKTIPVKDYDELLAAYHARTDELAKARDLLNQSENAKRSWACGWVGGKDGGRCVRLECKSSGPCTGWPGGIPKKELGK